MKYHKYRNLNGELPWFNVKNRVGKKLFNRLNMYRSNKKYFEWFLQCWTSLKVGDIVLTCRLHNAKIIDIQWEAYICNYPNIITDANVKFDDGFSCSLRHCISPKQSVEKIQDYFTGIYPGTFGPICVEPELIGSLLRDSDITVFNKDGILTENARIEINKKTAGRKSK